MKFKNRLLACAMAAVLTVSCIPQIPSRAEGNIVYAGGNGSAENSGLNADEPLNSIYAAQDLLPNGGTVLVTSTMYVTGERTYSLQDGIVLKAAEELEGPVFEVAEGGELTLNNIVIIGNDSTVISNSGVLRMDESVSLQVSAEEGVGCVYTNEGAGTYLNGELVAGTAQVKKETEETAADSESGETESSTGQTEPKESEDSTAQTEPKESEGSTAQTEPKESEGSAAQTELKESESAAQTEPKESESGTAQTEEKESESSAVQTETKATESTALQTESTVQSESQVTESVHSTNNQTEKEGSLNITETTESATETAKNIRQEAVNAVSNAIAAVSIHSREDVASLLAVSQAYDGLSKEEQEAIPLETRQLLVSAQEMAAAYNHTQLGVTVYGNLPWYVQFQVKLMDVSQEAEDGQKILVPYELKLWNLYTNSIYNLPEGETVTVTMPVPEVEIEGEFTIFHYKSDGTVESIKPVMKGNLMSFETSSFSPFTVAGSTVVTGIGIGTGSAGNITSTNQTETSSGTGTETSSSATGGNSSDTGTNSSSNGSVSIAANTGDTTSIWPMIAAAAAALIVILTAVLTRKKTKK